MKPVRLCTCAAVLVVAACQEQRTPMSPSLSADFSDAMHGSNRNPHFYLLPPFISAPDLTKEHFESGLRPSVRITEQPDGQPKFAGCTSNEPIAYLAATEFTSLKAYAVIFRPNNYSTVAPPCIYRLQVEVFGTASTSGAVLGFADVQVLSKSTIKFLQTGQYIPLPKDLSLPFWFFIGQGAVFFAESGTDACRTGRDCVEAVVSPTKDNTVITANKGAGIFIPKDAFASQVTLVVEEQTERPCIGPLNLALPEFSANRTGCYRYQRFPSNVTQSGELIVAMCVNIGLLTHDQADRLQIFRFEPEEEGGGVRALPNVHAGFLPCEDTRFPPLVFMPRLLDNLAALFVPRSLHAAAINLGIGGSCRAPCLSAPIFTWGMPGTVSRNSADLQTALVATPVAAAPSIKLLDPGNPTREIPPQPIANVPVTFDVGLGGGRIATPGVPAATTVVVTTGSDGVATLESWTLGSRGTNTVRATVPGADGSPVTFTATAIQPTTTSLLTSAPLAEVGSSITLSAVVSPAAPAAESPMAEFFDGETSLGTAAVNSEGVASFSTATLGLTEHSLSAAFLGTATFARSTSSTFAQHMIQRFTSLNAFNAVVGSAPVATQDFETIPVGTTIASIIPGVLDVTSPFDVLQVFASTACTCLFGFDNHTRAAGDGRYNLQFVASRNALSFDVEAQDPAAGAAHVDAQTAGGVVTFSVSNTTGLELNPVFFGVIATQPLRSVAVREGVEVSGTGSEEIALDDFLVASVTLP